MVEVVGGIILVSALAWLTIWADDRERARLQREALAERLRRG